MSKVIESAITRTSCTSRLQCFFVAVDILRNASIYTERCIKGKRCFEIIGYDANKTEVKIHLREDTERKDKILYFISSFQKK